MLSVRNISKAFESFALRDISFEVSAGQYFVLLGPTGVGKSVLLETIAGLTRPDSGNIYLEGRDITHEKIQKRGTAMVFQRGALFPHLNVYDNIAYPLRCTRSAKAQIRKQVRQLAEDFAVSRLLDRMPETLSGGESQRVSLARAVASEPQCLLLDEPISSLDVKSRPQMRGLLRRLNVRGRTILHVTHDYTEAVSLASNIAVMEKGTIAQTGTVEDVFLHPKSEFIARFVGIRNFFNGQLEAATGSGASARRFRTTGPEFFVLSDSSPGPGYVMIRSEDVTISAVYRETSARNNFEGRIVEIIPAATGVEVIVDIGRTESVEVAALITAGSVKTLKLQCGKKVWVSFKASAVRYVEHGREF